MISTIYANGREYDLLLSVPVRADELDFYAKRASAAGGPALELACGTGRLTIPLANSGLDITGIDNAESMLGVAREKAAECQNPARFVQADVRSFSLGRKFGLIFFPNNSLGHLHTLDDIRPCFSCVRDHLAEGGLFIIDFFNPSLALLMRDPETRYPIASYFDREGKYVMVTETVRYDAATQINHALWHYEREGVAEEVRPLDLRMYFPQELDGLVALNGFRVQAKYGDFAGTPFCRDSRQQVIVCSQFPIVPTPPA